MAQNGSGMTQNDPKWPKDDPKWPKINKNGKNDQKLTKSAQSDPNITPKFPVNSR